MRELLTSEVELLSADAESGLTANAGPSLAVKIYRRIAGIVRRRGALLIPARFFEIAVRVCRQRVFLDQPNRTRRSPSQLGHSLPVTTSV